MAVAEDGRLAGVLALSTVYFLYIAVLEIQQISTKSKSQSGQLIILWAYSTTGSDSMDREYGF